MQQHTWRAAVSAAVVVVLATLTACGTEEPPSSSMPPSTSSRTALPDDAADELVDEGERALPDEPEGDDLDPPVPDGSTSENPLGDDTSWESEAWADPWGPQVGPDGRPILMPLGGYQIDPLEHDDCGPYSLELDYLDETLTPEEFTTYAFFGIWDAESVPERYRPCADVEMFSSVGVLWSMQFLDHVDPEVRKEVTDFLTPPLVEPEA